MALITDQPEDLPTTNALDDVVDPDEQPEGERAEIYLSGAHVATLDNAPNGLERVTLMVELEVLEESVRFNENGDDVIAIRRCKRVGDMYRPGTARPPTKDEIKAMQAAGEAKRAAEIAAETDENQPPMFDDHGLPNDPDAMEGERVPAPGDEDDDQDAVPEPVVDKPAFSDVNA